MKTFCTVVYLALLTGAAFALPNGPFVRIAKIEGTVIEIPKANDQFFEVVKLLVTFTSSPDETKALYSTIRRKTEYPIQELKRPGRDEVILILPAKSLPAGMKVGDKIRVVGYSVRVSEAGLPPPHTIPQVDKIERNPKN